MACHWLALRFQAAASSCGAICARRMRITAMANGEHMTMWQIMTAYSSPDRPIRDKNASIARPRITTGMVGGSSANAMYTDLPKK